MTTLIMTGRDEEHQSPIYSSAEGHVMQREYEGGTENGCAFGGRWVLRDKDGNFMGVDQYRNDLMERFGFDKVHYNSGAI